MLFTSVVLFGLHSMVAFTHSKVLDEIFGGGYIESVIQHNSYLVNYESIDRKPLPKCCCSMIQLLAMLNNLKLAICVKADLE